VQIKAQYRSEDGYKVYVNMTAPREVCMELDTMISKYLSEKGFTEKEYRGGQ